MSRFSDIIQDLGIIDLPLKGLSILGQEGKILFKHSEMTDSLSPQNGTIASRKYLKLLFPKSYLITDHSYLKMANGRLTQPILNSRTCGCR